MKIIRVGALCLVASLALAGSAVITGCTTQQMADSSGSDNSEGDCPHWRKVV